MHRAILSGALFVVVGTAPSSAQLPTGYYEVAPTQLPDSLREVIAGGRFTISITRRIANATESRLIERAEALMPSPEVIASSTEGLAGDGWVAGFAAAAKLPGDRWWWREWDGALLPVAVTGRAVLHYLERVRALSGQPNPFARHNPGVQHRATLSYTALVRANTVTGRREVHLNLSYEFYCGPLCAVSFTHARVVEFDQDGQPVAVHGDGRPRVVVS
ncbi:MAG: hypothetical protein P3B98_08915 [Gemmatimonadota bacterium]|nr:hypothetical protein [Gemmatimonadota bacterium]